MHPESPETDRRHDPCIPSSQQDEVTVIRQGRTQMSLPADEARPRFRNISARATGDPSDLPYPEILQVKEDGSSLEILTSNYSEKMIGETAVARPGNC
jgi:hypothetical protein